MGSQPQNPEFRINPENFHPCYCLITRTFSTEIISFISKHFYFLIRLVGQSPISRRPVEKVAN